MSSETDYSYVIPLRWQSPEAGGDEMTEYLGQLAGWCNDVIVVDGSPEQVFSANHAAWSGRVRHIPPAEKHRCLMGKVCGVLTGIEAARHERVIVADDDVRYNQATVGELVRMLDSHDLVAPQNFFWPMPWHALWDTARTLLNRATGADFPGTLGVRRSFVLAMGGYDGDVMFENLELIRTVQAHGGRTARPLDLFVRRLPPTSTHFWGQRTRQAYDDFAIPARMALWLSILPALAVAVYGRRLRQVSGAALGTVLLAERGRSRGCGSSVFPPATSLLAPGWVLERGVCAWLAVLQRVRFGGVRYGDSIIRVAAHSPRQLRARARARARRVGGGKAGAVSGVRAEAVDPGAGAVAGTVQQQPVQRAGC